MEPFSILRAELKIRGYSEKTIKAYLNYNGRFLHFIKKSPRSITRLDIVYYLEYLRDHKHSNATLNLAYSALRFYYAEILGRRFFTNLKRAKRDKKLPLVLSSEEIKRMIEVTENIKHTLILRMLYASGLRVSELIRLKIEDIDIPRKLIWVRQGKGAKDRLTLLSESIVQSLISYLSQRRFPSEYLFNNKDRTLSIRTIQKIVETAAKKAKIAKKVHCHTLRASFATHLLEAGINLAIIQKLLGHSKPETTQFYIQLSSRQLEQVKSPLDAL